MDYIFQISNVYWLVFPTFLCSFLAQPAVNIPKKATINKLHYNNSFFSNGQWRVSHWNPYICFCLSPTYIYCMAKRRLNIIFQIDFHIFLIVLKSVLSDLLDYTAIYLIPTYERWDDFITCIFIVADRSSRNLKTSLNSFSICAAEVSTEHP